MAKVLKCEMSFRRSTLFLIRKKHSDIDLFRINFLGMKGHNIPNSNDGSVVVPARVDEVGDDEGDKVDDFTTFEDAEDASSADLMALRG